MKKYAMALVLFFGACSSGGSSGGGGGTTGGGGTPPGPGGGTAPTYTGSGTGTHYWISAGGNDAGPGTQGQPWATVDRIETANLQPGDLVHIQPGTYDLNTNLSLNGIQGSAGAWIGIQAEGSVTIRNSAVQNVVTIQNCSYLFLKGLDITHDNGGQAYGTWDAVDGIKFQNSNSNDVSIDSCRIHDVGNVGIGSQAPLITNVTVYNCEIDNCYTGLYWGYYEAANKRYANYGRIANNYIHDCPP